MAELLSIMLLIVLSIASRLASNYYSSLHDLISVSIIFFIVIRIFKYCLGNKSFSQNKKALCFSSLYTLTLFDGFLGVLYFADLLDCLLWLKILVEVFINLSVLTVFLFMKKQDMKEKKEYMPVYVRFQLIDLSLVLTLFVLSIIIRPQLLVQFRFLTILIELLLFADFCVKTYIDKKKIYWYHKKVLYTYFDIIIQTKKLKDILKEPLERDVSSDYILSESRYIMQYSFMRAYSLNEITKAFYDKCRKFYMSNTESIKYTALLSALLMTNLMKRQFDFAIMPTFIVNPLQFLIRKHKLKKLTSSK